MYYYRLVIGMLKYRTHLRISCATRSRHGVSESKKVVTKTMQVLQVSILQGFLVKHAAFANVYRGAL